MGSISAFSCALNRTKKFIAVGIVLSLLVATIGPDTSRAWAMAARAPSAAPVQPVLSFGLQIPHQGLLGPVATFRDWVFENERGLYFDDPLMAHVLNAPHSALIEPVTRRILLHGNLRARMAKIAHLKPREQKGVIRDFQKVLRAARSEVEGKAEGAVKALREGVLSADQIIEMSIWVVGLSTVYGGKVWRLEPLIRQEAAEIMDRRREAILRKAARRRS